MTLCRSTYSVTLCSFASGIGRKTVGHHLLALVNDTRGEIRFGRIEVSDQCGRDAVEPAAQRVRGEPRAGGAECDAIDAADREGSGAGGTSN
jgi:hypothetical protein